MTYPCPRLYDATKISLNILIDQVERERREALCGVPSIHRGALYEQAVVRFLRKCKRLERQALPEMRALDAKITALHGRGWNREPEIVALRLGLCRVARAFSQHPSKNVGACLVLDDNRLLATAANGVPTGLPLHGRYFLEGTRKRQILCAERLVLAKVFGFAAALPHAYNVGRKRDQLVRSAVQNLDRRLTHDVQGALAQAVLMVTTRPCLSCARAIVAAHVGEVIADPTTGLTFKRKDSFESATRLLEANGVRVLRFTPRTNTFV
jgi:deoxycytidylate deaminase